MSSRKLKKELKNKKIRFSGSKPRKLPFFAAETFNLKLMEQLNRIEIRGNVGNVRLQAVGDNTLAHFTVATNFAYKDKDSTAVIDTDWHNVTVWQDRCKLDLGTLKKGSRVYVCGRLRMQKYLDQDEKERTGYEIIARTVSLIDDDGPFGSECS